MFLGGTQEEGDRRYGMEAHGGAVPPDREPCCRKAYFVFRDKTSAGGTMRKLIAGVVARFIEKRYL